MHDARPGRDPLLTDGLVVVVVAAAYLVNSVEGEHAGGIDAPGALAIAFTAGALLFRRRAPLLVLATTAVGILAVLETTKPVETIALAPMVALYTVALQRGCVTGTAAGVAMLPVAAGVTLLFSPHGLLDLETLKNLAFVVIPVTVGLNVRDRREAAAAMRERAERAEATREEEALRRVGEERLRIAREVHDVVAHAMVAINVQAGVAAHVIDQRPDAARDALGEIKRVSGESLADLRATLGVLREPDGEAPTRPAPDVASIGELVRRLESAGAHVSLSERGVHEPPPAVGAAAYRVVQEALTNAMRHAPGASISVEVVRSPHGVEVDVRDDGAAGPGAVAEGSGHGLDGMRERVASVGGTLQAGPRDGGWRVHAWLPGRSPAPARA